MINWVIVAYQCNVVHCDFIYEKWKMMICHLKEIFRIEGSVVVFGQRSLAVN